MMHAVEYKGTGRPYFILLLPLSATYEVWEPPPPFLLTSGLIRSHHTWARVGKFASNRYLG